MPTDAAPSGASRTITQDDVARMANLARLSLDDKERELFAGQFQDILGYMDVLGKVDTQGVEPLYSPALHKEQGRQDEPARLRSRDEVLANAPQQDDGSFVVPRIV
ncbi:MAG: Asp-tRNA(Asn)/Glu-tRNA(Gln) amidotransferase subunit GatC [Desulfovibrio sp.]|nr:Asp-tRNA(Asn)/Glu-tRNA(Gln) amidotransferase subunit GatC [Desulfovibrio sp.]